MTQADFLTSISPDQLAAFTAIRDAIQAANAAQNLELAAAKESDFDKERTANAAALAELQKSLDAANVIAATAPSLQSQLDVANATIAAAKVAYLAEDHDTIAKLISDSEKTEKQKQADVLNAQIADAQAQLAALNA